MIHHIIPSSVSQVASSACAEMRVIQTVTASRTATPEALDRMELAALRLITQARAIRDQARAIRKGGSVERQGEAA